MMFGYASNETEALMPMPIHLAHRFAERLAAVRKDGSLGYLGPDGKTQVSVRYADGRPVAVEKLLISTQHDEGVDSQATIRPGHSSTTATVGQIRRPTSGPPVAESSSAAS